MLRYELCGLKVNEDKDIPFFGALSSRDGILSLPLFNHKRGVHPLNPAQDLHELVDPEGVIVEANIVGLLDANVLNPEPDEHFDDVDYEDEFDFTLDEAHPVP